MDQITQQLGFDASQCFTEITRLDGVLAQFEKRLQQTSTAFPSFNAQAGRTVNAFINLSKQGTAASSAIAAVAAAQGNMAPAQNAQAAAQAAAQLAAAMNNAGVAGQSASVKIGNAMVRIGKQSQQTATQVVANSERMTTSLQLLSRIVFTQFIVRSLSQMRRAFTETTTAAAEFQQQIALIQTIDQSGTSFGQLSDDIIALSNSLNIPRLEAAAGVYNSLSNQVGSTAESLEFAAKAGLFARASNSSLGDSVDLLSGAIKGFGKEFSETDHIASVFFRTIDLGRLSSGELANSFGRVNATSEALGLSVEEVNGALAAMTIVGTKSSEAITQLRGIESALVKPSEALKKALADLGFSSGQMATKTLGLVGTLRALKTSTGGSASELAALFPNVRALTGVTTLAAGDFKVLSDNINELQSVPDNFAASKAMVAMGTDAEKAFSAVNKLSNAVVTNLGDSLLGGTAKLIDLGGGVDNLTDLIALASPAIIGLGISITGLATAFTTANLAGVKLSRTLGLLALVPAAVGAGEAIADFINSRVSDANTVGLKALEKANAEELKVFTDGLKQKRGVADKADQDRLQASRKLAQELNKVYLQDVANAKAANDQLVFNAKTGFEEVVSAREGMVEALAKASSDAIEFARDSQSRISELGELQGDRDFEFKTSGLSEAERVLALTKRANEIAQSAVQFIQNGSILGDESQIENGVRLFEKAQQTGEAALSAAGDSSDAQRRVYSQLKGITNLQISAEQQLIQTQKQRFEAIEAERKKQQEITDEIKRQTQIALDNTGELDSKGNQFSAEEQLRRETARVEALKKVASLALNQGDLNAAGALGIADFVARFNQELSQKPLQLAFDINQQSEKIKADLAKSFETFKLKIGVDVQALSEVVGRDLVTPDQVAQAQEEATKLAADIRKKIDDAMALGARSTQLQEELTEALNGVEATAGRRADPRTGNTGEAANAEFNSIVALLKQAQEQGTLTEETLNKIIEKRNEFGKKLTDNNGFLNDLKRSFDPGLEQFDNALQRAQQLIEVQQQLPKEAPAALNEQLARLEAVLNKDPAGQFGGAQTAMANSVSSAQAIADAWERAAAAAERAAKAAQSGGSSASVRKAFGGKMFLASGGGARGIDTIPAMLSPGEFVMNAQSSRKWFAQLQAMNAGQMPAYRNEGGSVTTIGDTTVNMTVNGAGDPVKTGDEIIRRINRTQRRGTNRIQ